VSGAHGVAARIAALCLDDDGCLRGDAYLTIAVRGGLLVDLALVGRLEQTEDSVELDPTPVGWPPTDAALAELDALDGRSLDWWLGHSHLGPVDVAVALVQDGIWEEAGGHGSARRRCFTERNLEPGLRDLALLEGSQAPGSSEDAAVLAIIDASGVPDLRDPVSTVEPLLAGAGPVRWVCELVTAYLNTVRATEGAVRSATAGQLRPIPPV
jgi:hypothetical protein